MILNGGTQFGTVYKEGWQYNNWQGKDVCEDTLTEEQQTLEMQVLKTLHSKEMSFHSDKIKVWSEKGQMTFRVHH